MRSRFNAILRASLLGSRWGMAPFCLGLIVALLLVAAQFFRELAHAVAAFAEMGDSDVILAVLKLVDLVLIANLVVMIISAGVEIFLPAAVHRRDQEEGTSDIVDIAALKPRLFASISANRGDRPVGKLRQYRPGRQKRRAVGDCDPAGLRPVGRAARLDGAPGRATIVDRGG